MKAMNKKRMYVILMLITTLVMSFPIAVNASSYDEWDSDDSLPTRGAYKLTKDVVIETTFFDYPTVTGNLILDLNGHKITVAGEGRYAYFVNSGGNLTIEDSVGGGKITNEGITASLKTLIQVNANSSFTLNGGCLENTTSSGYALFVNSGSAAELNGGSVINTAKSGCAVQLNSDSKGIVDGAVISNTAENAYAVYVNGNASLEMKSGKISTETTYSSKAAIYANNLADSVKISGGVIESKTVGVYAAFTTVEVTGGTIEAADYAFQTRNAAIAPTDDDISVKSGEALFYTFSDSANTISGGNFDSPKLVKEYTETEGNAELIVSGGTFSSKEQISDYIDDESVAAGYTGDDGNTVFFVGTDEEINNAVKEASDGDVIEIIYGNIELKIDNGGVVVKNSSGGKVSVNDANVEKDGTVITEDKEPVDPTEPVEPGEPEEENPGTDAEEPTDVEDPTDNENPADNDEPAADTEKPEDKDSDIPKTGEETTVLPWLAVMLAAAGAAVAALKRSANR